MTVPQIPVYTLLEKFDGSTVTSNIGAEEQVRRTYKIRKLPKYLILHLNRIEHNINLDKIERNHTVVTFPGTYISYIYIAHLTAIVALLRVYHISLARKISRTNKTSLFTILYFTSFYFTYTVKNLDLSPFYTPADKNNKTDTALEKEECPSIDQLSSLSVQKLKQVIKSWGSARQQRELEQCVEKADLTRLCTEVATDAAGKSHTKYSLIANICRESVQSTSLQGVSIGAGGESNNIAVSNALYTKATSVAALPPCKVHVQNIATKQWFELQDLRVDEIMPQLIPLSESSVLLYSNE